MPKKQDNPFRYWIQPALDHHLLTPKQVKRLDKAFHGDQELPVDLFPLVQWVNLVGLPPELIPKFFRAH